MRALVVGLLIATGSAAQAAPWSFEIPPGFTEQPDAAESQLTLLRAQPSTVSVDAQIYLSADASVQLTRMSWSIKLPHRPTRKTALELERGTVDGAAEQGSKHVSDTRRFVADQLVSETVDEVQDMQMRRRTLFAADTSGVVHMFIVICTGPAAQLGDCEKAQQTMQLVLPNPAPFISAPQDRNTSTAYTIGQYIGFFVLVVLIGLWIKSGAPIFRRKPKPDAPK